MSIEGYPLPSVVDVEQTADADKKLLSALFSGPVRLESGPDMDKSCGTAGPSDDGHRSGELPTTFVEPDPDGTLLDSPLMLNSGDPVA